MHGPIDRGLGQELDRHRLTQREIVRAIHLAHAAASEQRNDAVARRSQDAGREAPFVASGAIWEEESEPEGPNP